MLLYGRPEGNGEVHWVGTDLLFYRGEFKEGKPHGKGTIYHEAGGQKYSGDFKNGSMEGQISIYRQKGSMKFSGKHDYNGKNGKGFIYYKNGKFSYNSNFQGM